MTTKRPPPGWILAAYDPKYLRDVLAVLAKRESRRDVARDASRPSRPAEAKALFRSSQKSTAPPDQIEHYSVDIGASQLNKHRNRYLHLEPYNRTRVVVGTLPDNEQIDPNTRYINASWVLEKYGHKWWIASQAPLPQTSHSFLSILLQPVTRPPPTLLPPTSTSIPRSSSTRIRTVVQLTQNIESGRRKAHAYFPTVVGKTLIIPAEEGHQAPALKVTLLHQETIEEAHCLRSTVAVVPVNNPPPVNPFTYENVEFDNNDDGASDFGEQHDQRIVFTHLLYTSWPDHGVPEAEDRESLVSFICLAERLNRDISLTAYPPSAPPVDSNLNPDPPIIVGCSAGVGRTGSFIALSSLMRRFGVLEPAAFPTPSLAIPPSPLGSLPEQLENDCVVQEIDGLREQRQRMVERPEQVVLIYEVLLKDIFAA